MYLCEDISDQESSSPNKVLIRLLIGRALGEEGLRDFEQLSPASQAVVYDVMARLGHGPGLYGILDGGRVKEYVPSTVVQDDHLRNTTIRRQIATQLARFHSLEFPRLEFKKETQRTFVAIIRN